MSKMDQEQRIAYLQKNDWSTAPVPKEYRRSDYGVVVTLVGQIIALSARRSTPCSPAADGLLARQQLVSGAAC